MLVDAVLLLRASLNLLSFQKQKELQCFLNWKGSCFVRYAQGAQQGNIAL